MYNYFSKTISNNEILHDILMGLTDPTPFLRVVWGEAPLLGLPDCEHLLSSEGKRIKNCEDSKDAVTERIQEKNSQKLHYDLFSYFMIMSKVNICSDLWAPLLSRFARTPCWIVVGIHTLRSQRLVAARCARWDTNTHGCTNRCGVSDCWWNSSADFPSLNTTNSRWGTTPCAWHWVLVQLKILHILRWLLSHTLHTERTRNSTAPCLDTRKHREMFI